LASLLAALGIVAACSSGADWMTAPDSGGSATVADESGSAFALPIPTLTDDQRRHFFVGNSFFNDNWVTAPASTEGRDGLGPTFNAQSCSSCHFHDGRGIPPDENPSSLGLLLRLSVTGPNGPEPDPVYGDQLQDRSILGVPAEGSIGITYGEHPVTLPDGSVDVLPLPIYEVMDLAFGELAPGLAVSPRLAPQLAGVGLLEAVPEETIVSMSDLDDEDGDGISGRPNRVTDLRTGEAVLGRFGWKAGVATVEQQVAAAFNGDIGITSSVLPDEHCGDAQPECAAAPNGGTPELDDLKLERISFYTRTLAVPARRDVEDPLIRQGANVFDRIGCTSCHVPTLTTGSSDIDQLADQVIHPYSDLLLHDMGEGLADGRPDGLATGSEWRTPPLWGLGLLETVSGEARYLHDGRARTLHEAIMWHEGEASAARHAYAGLSDDDLAALEAFLASL
jgi:CxxC motif-containing protein (DUF1111 family)